MPSFLYVLEELCASLRIVGKRESKDPEFQKEYLKLVDEEPTAVIPDEIESVVKENFRAILKSSRYSKISTRQLLCRLVNRRAG
jgi:23S rRNA maturation mini-RNase III